MISGYSAYGSPIPALPHFKAAFPWIGGDLQTLKNNLTWSAPYLPLSRQQRLSLPMNDGTGDILLGPLDRPELDQSLPLLILIHGLTGCESSRNIMVSTAHFLSVGFPVLRLNLRGAGPSLGLCREHYHAGRSEDLIAVIAALPDSLKQNGLVMVGVSLGGNTLLKTAGERKMGGSILAIASVSSPIDLRMAQTQIMAKPNNLYHRYLLNRMKQDAMEGAQDNAAIREALKSVTSVYDYDNLIVAPQNGFDGAEDYYDRCSAMNFLENIRIPALLVHAATDPWIPLEMYSRRTWPKQGNLSFVLCQDGGHVGFHSRGSKVPWHNRCISEFFLHAIGR